MKYISLAAHNNELILVKDMDSFTAHFCYSKKQRHGAVDVIPPVPESAGDVEEPITRLEVEEVEIADEDDL